MDNFVRDVDLIQRQKKYYLLDYIRSRAEGDRQGQFLNTGIYGTSNTKWDMKIRPLSISTWEREVFAVVSSNTSNKVQVGWLTTQEHGYNYRAINCSCSFSAGLGTSDCVIIGSSSITTNYPFYIFAQNDRGTQGCDTYMRLYYAKIWNGGKLVRDYIPAQRIKDGVVGMYDKVSQTLFVNGSSNAGFVAGNIIGKF